jgi:hypothetical protein
MVAPLPSHCVHRAERRSMLLDASAPHLMIHGARAVGDRYRQRSQITHSHSVTPRRLATDILAVRLIVAAWCYSHLAESHEAQLPRQRDTATS